MSRKGARVLMTADTLGGVFTYALDLARSLERLQVEVVLATMGRPADAAQRREARSVPSLTLVESSYALEWMDEPWDDVDRAGDWLLDLEQRYAPDVVHLNGYAHGTLPFRAPVLVVAHSCVLSWWDAVKGGPAPAHFDTYRERVRAGLRGADMVVAPTHAMRSALQHHYGPVQRALVVSNACDLDFFEPRPKRPFVLAAGRVWDEAKNLATLARAAASLPWPVCIAGEAARPAGIGDARTLLGDHVRMLGHQPRARLAQLLGEAAIYALPARYEPFGLSVLEAAASGAALVLGDIASLRELWDGAALFVQPDDAQALGAAITQLSRDEALRKRLSLSSRSRAQRFQRSLQAQHYAVLYNELQTFRFGQSRATAAASKPRSTEACSAS